MVTNSRILEYAYSIALLVGVPATAFADTTLDLVPPFFTAGWHLDHGEEWEHGITPLGGLVGLQFAEYGRIEVDLGQGLGRGGIAQRFHLAGGALLTVVDGRRARRGWTLQIPLVVGYGYSSTEDWGLLSEPDPTYFQNSHTLVGRTGLVATLWFARRRSPSTGAQRRALPNRRRVELVSPTAPSEPASRRGALR